MNIVMSVLATTIHDNSFKWSLPASQKYIGQLDLIPDTDRFYDMHMEPQAWTGLCDLLH